jgi:hypothetical protein
VVYALLVLREVNAGIEGNKAIYEPAIVGIIAASLNAESFLSAASFQETSRVLTRDALEGKTDFCARMPSAVGYQPTLATEMGGLQERITSTKDGSITSIQAVQTAPESRF